MKKRPPRKMTTAERKQRAQRDHEAIQGGVARATDIAEGIRQFAADQRKLKKKTLNRHEFVLRLASMKNEAARLGLFQTVRALDEATQQAGWELAARIDVSQTKTRDRYLRSRNRSKL